MVHPRRRRRQGTPQNPQGRRHPPPRKMRAWITFDTKLKQAHDNTAKNNFAPTFKLKSPGTVEEKNQKVTQAIYEEALKKNYKLMCDKFGAKHFAANCERLTIK